MPLPFSSLLSRLRRRAKSGSTLVAAMLTVVVLALVAANVIESVTARYNSAYRSASWNEALLTADAGVNVVASEVFRIIPNVSLSAAQGLGVGFSQPSLGLITGLNISAAGLLANGTILSITPPALTHGGEGGTVQQATVSLDVVPLSQLLSGGVPAMLSGISNLLGGKDLQLLRVRSTGTVFLTGGRRASPSRLDNELWRPSLITDRLTGSAAAQPSIARQVEVLLRPVYPFEATVASDDSFFAVDSGAVFDSFNSTQSSSSTGGLYDSQKRRAGGKVRSNSATVALGGTVYGDLYTNGADAPQDSHVTGTVNNASFTPLPIVNAPTWAGNPLAPGSIAGPTSLAAGPALLPAQYRFTGISGDLHITQGLLNLGTAVEIYVNGDLTGGIEIDSGITAKVYVSGSINTKASKLKNDGARASSLQIYGVPNGAGVTQQITLASDANLIAAIYAPAHNLTLSGSSDFSGSIVCKQFQLTGAMRVHYDESLAASVGPLLRYQIASWKEIIL